MSGPPSEMDRWRAQRSGLWAMKVGSQQLLHETREREKAQARERARTDAYWAKRRNGGGGGGTRTSSGGVKLVMPIIMALVVYGGWQITTGEMAGDKGTGFWMLAIGVLYFVWKIRRIARS